MQSHLKTDVLFHKVHISIDASTFFPIPSERTTTSQPIAAVQPPERSMMSLKGTLVVDWNCYQSCQRRNGDISSIRNQSHMPAESCGMSQELHHAMSSLFTPLVWLYFKYWMSVKNLFILTIFIVWRLTSWPEPLQGCFCFIEDLRTCDNDTLTCLERGFGGVYSRGHLLCRELLSLRLLLQTINEAPNPGSLSSIGLFDDSIVSAIKPTGNLRRELRENKIK